jgi:ComF family protein
MVRVIWSYVKAFLDLIYPAYTHCVMCMEAWPEEGKPLCMACYQSLPWVGDEVCVCCGSPLTKESHTYCEQCESEVHEFQHARAPFRYEKGIAELIWRFKYSSETTLAPLLGEWVNDTLNQAGWDCEVIVPVPLHTKRQRQRGYNQAELLANEVGKWQGMTVVNDALMRKKSTHTQTTLNRKQRLENLNRVFEVTNTELIHGKKILLVDDVYTTGATADQCSRALNEAGVAAVYVLTLAYTNPNRKKNRG